MRMLVALLSALSGCTGTGSVGSSAPDKPVLRVAGSDTLTRNLLPALAQTHQRTRGDLAIELVSGDSATGIRALLDGEVDIAASSSDVTPSEEEQARANKFTFDDPEVRHIIGVDVVSVAVHPSNPTQSLTYDQVIGVFCTRTIDNWSFLGLDDRPIRALTRAPASGTRALFEDFFCGPRGIHHKVEEVDTATIDAALSDDPSAIAFVSLSEGVGKLLALRAEPASEPVRPSQQNIIRGAYPLYRDVYLFTNGPAAGYSRSFLDWIASPAGQEVVDEQRFVPLFLRPDRLDEPRPLRETIHFEPESSEPNQRSTTRLRLLVDELEERQLRHVVLEGFTDDREPNPYELSRQRADAVRQLIAAEIPELYFEIIPRGPRDPLAPNDTPYGRQRNRRVQIYLAEDEK